MCASHGSRRDEFHRRGGGGGHRQDSRSNHRFSGGGRDGLSEEALSKESKRKNGGERAASLKAQIMYNTDSGLDALEQLERTGRYRVKHRWDGWANGTAIVTSVFYELNDKVIVVGSAGQWWTQDEIQGLYRVARARRVDGSREPTELLCLHEAMSCLVALQLRLPCYPPEDGSWTYTGHWAAPRDGRRGKPPPPPSIAAPPANPHRLTPASDAGDWRRQSFTTRGEAEGFGKARLEDIQAKVHLSEMPDRPPPDESPERNAMKGFGRLGKEELHHLMFDKGMMWGDIWAMEFNAKISKVLASSPPSPAPETDSDTSTETDSDTSTDTDSGSDSDTDSDSDSDTEGDGDGDASGQKRPNSPHPQEMLVVTEPRSVPEADVGVDGWETVAAKPRRGRRGGWRGGRGGGRWKQTGGRRPRGRR